MKKIVLTFGLIAGAVMSLLMVISMYFHDEIGFDRGIVVGYTSMILAFLAVYFGVRAYRDNVNGGSVTFGRAFRVGITISAIGTLCYVATWEVVYRTMVPDYLDKYGEYMVERDRKEGKSEAEIAEAQKEMDTMKEVYKNPIYRAGFTLVEPLPVGLLMTLIAAGLLRREVKAPGT